MPMKSLCNMRAALPLTLAAAAFSLSAFAAAKVDKTKPAPKPAEVDPYAEVQPAEEKIDIAAYQRIRDEGLNHSHVMDFAYGLMDGIGPRLTGSPDLKKANEWTRDTLTKIGCENAHLEDWGEFGMGWQQLNTWARMVTPDTAILILQATPWSPSTPGPVTGDVVFVSIQSEKDFDTYKGKLGGKVVLYGAMREVPPVDKALFERYTDKELEEMVEMPVSGNGGGMSPEMQARLKAYMERGKLIDKIAAFFTDEKVAAVIEPRMVAAPAAHSLTTTAPPSAAPPTSPKKL
jgi:carboxypeptidase Q